MRMWKHRKLKKPAGKQWPAAQAVRPSVQDQPLGPWPLAGSWSQKGLSRCPRGTVALEMLLGVTYDMHLSWPLKKLSGLLWTPDLKDDPAMCHWAFVRGRPPPGNQAFKITYLCEYLLCPRCGLWLQAAYVLLSTPATFCARVCMSTQA